MKFAELTFLGSFHSQITFNVTKFDRMYYHMGNTKPCCHPLPFIYSLLPSISTLFQPSRTHFQPITTHIQLTLTHFKPTPTHMQPLSPISSPQFTYSHSMQPFTYNSQLCLYMCLRVSRAHVPIHFCTLYCLCLFVIVNMLGQFIYTAFFKNILVIPVFFSQCLFPPMVSLPMFLSAFISLML